PLQSQGLIRTTPCLKHPVFQSYHSETKMLRYIHKLQEGDLSLAHSMIPLGSCTMKLNSTTELTPVSWPGFSHIHPFAPFSQTQGYQKLIKELEQYLCEITGFSSVSFQPNAGSQGEYTGLLIIRKWHEENKNPQRKICLIPSSAHGTNPASAVMAGLKPVTVHCNKEGNISREDLKRKIDIHGNELAAFMLTFPSTFGVFEKQIPKICEWIHAAGGLVYLDGANMNALIGISQPAKWGADVCHLNLHKTFCIPHGGGGPGVGPVAVTKKLAQFLPSHPIVPECGPAKGISAISSAPWGSAGILMISWAYIRLMGPGGLKKATQTAILNANYISQKLSKHYKILYTGDNNRVAHECILDLRKFRNTAEITVDDVAKRLIDYGFHAPTMSWPVPGTLMIEPTESEDKKELDRFCDALIEIRKEIQEIENKKFDIKKNVLKQAPHTLEDALQEKWPFPYSKEKAFYPLPWVKEHKFWPRVSRVENAYGDINLFCACPPIDS
ncbi:MAG: aminotransferase class V-fold PLP-dependent enzyme, partial [Oligoflexia bacterium]|nr:aminotransferase class V-fold PLP-dependent enzyme [Oligoflexia bacterium]